MTNGEWLAFMEAGGYASRSLARRRLGGGQAHDWRAPGYWEKRDGVWHAMTLEGLLPVDPRAPVAHISYYEANAFAHWAGKRLPTEFEWEAAQGCPSSATTSHRRAAPASCSTADGRLAQMFGDVWEWTSSAYLPYPGYRPPAGAVGEYNGKFMVSQNVLRGGSCATPPGHIRASYRNFFFPTSAGSSPACALPRR